MAPSSVFQESIYLHGSACQMKSHRVMIYGMGPLLMDTEMVVQWLGHTKTYRPVFEPAFTPPS